MRKLIFFVLALFAFVSCSTGLNEPVDICFPILQAADPGDIYVDGGTRAGDMPICNMCGAGSWNILGYDPLILECPNCLYWFTWPHEDGPPEEPVPDLPPEEISLV